MIEWENHNQLKQKMRVIDCKGSRKIIDAIHKHGIRTTAEITEVTGKSQSSTSTLLNKLKRHKILKIAKQEKGVVYYGFNEHFCKMYNTICKMSNFNLSKKTS